MLEQVIVEILPEKEPVFIIPDDESVSPKKWYNGAELLEMEIEEIPKLWDPYLPRTSVAMLVGSSDCGKSTLLRQLATAICRGETKFLGSSLNAVYEKVCIVSTEDDEFGVASSLTKQTKAEKDKDYIKNLKVLFDSENAFSQVEKLFAEEPCDLVILDSWGDILEGNPNDFTAVRKAIKPWQDLSMKYHCLIILLHHTVKNSDKVSPDKNRVNGSQGMEAKARCVLELRQGNEADERILSVLKCNSLPEEVKRQSMVLHLDSEFLLFENTGKVVDRESIGKCAVKKDHKWITDEAQKSKDDNKSTYDGVRNAMLKKYGEEKTPSLTWFKENLK